MTNRIEMKDFSEQMIDAQGSAYVIHRPTGVRYYIREEPTRAKNAAGPTKIMTRDPAAKSQRKEGAGARVSKKRQPSPEFQQALAFTPRPLTQGVLTPKGERVMRERAQASTTPLSQFAARARFIPGSEPTSPPPARARFIPGTEQPYC